MSESLIKADAREAMKTDEQLLLFYGAEIERIDRSTAPGEYSGERFFARRPQAYELCVRMCADPGISTRQICKVLHITDDTVRGVRSREGELVKGHQRILSRKLEHSIQVLADRVIEQAPVIPGDKAALALGILYDKHALINGGATARMEVSARIDFGDALQKLHSAAAEMLAMKRAAVVELGSGISELGTGEAVELAEVIP